MFSFKDEPDLYESPKLKKHGAGVLKYVDSALADFAGQQKALAGLGERHQARGVQIPHYKVVGDALVLTLQDALGDAFTPELKESWIAVYSLVCSAMQGDLYS